MGRPASWGCERVMTAVPDWQLPQRDGSWGSASVRWCSAALMALTVHGLAVWFYIQDKPATELDLRLKPPAGMDISIAAPDAAAAPEAAASRQAAAEPEPAAMEQAPDMPDNVAPQDLTSVRPAPVEPSTMPSAHVTDPISVPVRSPPAVSKRDVEPSLGRQAVHRDDKRPRLEESRRSSRTARTGLNARATGSINARSASTAQGSSPVRVSPAAWQGAVLAHLDRFKRSPGGGSGVATVAFIIDRGGHVLSARLVGSAGNSTLDAEAVSLPRRASPVPSPPAGVGSGDALSLTVPVRFK